MKPAAVRSLVVALTLVFSVASISPALALPTKFKGQPVTILVRGATNDNNIYLWGTVTDMDETSIWIDQTHVKYMPAGTSASAEKDVYVPWATITYIKPDKS